MTREYQGDIFGSWKPIEIVSKEVKFDKRFFKKIDSEIFRKIKKEKRKMKWEMK